MATGTTGCVTKEVPIEKQTCDGICGLLQRHGVPSQHVEKFRSEEIDGCAFLKLNKYDLKEYFKLPFGICIKIHEIIKSCQVPGKEHVSEDFLGTGRVLCLDNQTPEVGTRSTGETIIPGTSGESKGATKTSCMITALSKQFPNLTRVKSREDTIRLHKLRHIFGKKGTDGNQLDQLFIFLVLSKDEMNGDQNRKLWTEVTKPRHLQQCIKLLQRDQQGRFILETDHTLLKATGEMINLSSKKIKSTYLNNIDAALWESTTLVLLVERDVINSCPSRIFLTPEKEQTTIFDVGSRSTWKYHAVFHGEKQSMALDWCLSEDVAHSISDVATCEMDKHQGRVELIKTRPRTFISDSRRISYGEGTLLDCHETGPINLLRPVHECKLFEYAVKQSLSSGTPNHITKFVRETIRFACACLNSRTNGTIHFGIADEDPTKAGQFGKQPMEIVGVNVPEKFLYIDKLNEFIGKCFGTKQNLAKQCIMPPEFVPVRCEDSGDEPSTKFVIEVDIEPRSSICEDSLFRVSIPTSTMKGKESQPVKFVQSQCFVRDGSSSKEIKDEDLANYLEDLKKIQLDREKREKDSDNEIRKKPQERQEELGRKLKRIMGLEKQVLDKSFYRILVLNRAEENTEETLKERFEFLSQIDWGLVLDFDSSASQNTGLCGSISSRRQFDFHELSDYETSPSLLDRLLNRPQWIFANGWAEGNKVAYDAREFVTSERRRGLTKLIDSISNKGYPKNRTLVVFMLLGSDMGPMSRAYGEFATYYEKHQLASICDDIHRAELWQNELISSYTSREIVDQTSVIGIKWCHVRECIQQIVRGYMPSVIYVPLDAKNLSPLQPKMFDKNIITVLNARECSELGKLQPKEFRERCDEEETQFYKGNEVTWYNLWFTDQGYRHIIPRDCLRELEERVKDALKLDGKYNRVVKITLYYQKGTGATTVLRQLMWNFSCMKKGKVYLTRSCIVNKINDETINQIFTLHSAFDISDYDTNLLPVLALVDGVDESLVQELYISAMKKAKDVENSEHPVLVILYGQESLNPRGDAKDDPSSCYLGYKLSEQEYDDFKRKFEEMKAKYGSEVDFDVYASENFISFMMIFWQEPDARKRYVEKLVSHAFDNFNGIEKNLATYLSLLNIYDPCPVFIVCFDSLMTLLGHNEKRKPLYSWKYEITPTLEKILREQDVSEHIGTGRAVSIIHPEIAEYVLDFVSEQNDQSIADIVLAFLTCDIFAEMNAYPKPLEHLRMATNMALKVRKRRPHRGTITETRFSPLIEKILKPGGPMSFSTKINVQEAANVLSVGMERFKDPMCSQHIARLFYVHAKLWREGDFEWFDKAVESADLAIRERPNNPFILDTMGRVYKEKLQVKFTTILAKHSSLKPSGEIIEAIDIALHAMRWFQGSQKIYEEGREGNKANCFGELDVLFFVLELLECVTIFRNTEGTERLRKYLNDPQYIPEEILAWNLYNTEIKGFRNRYLWCMASIDEDMSVFKERGADQGQGDRLMKVRKYKASFLTYFTMDEKVIQSMSGEERIDHRWNQIQNILRGGIFWSIFNIPLEDVAKLVRIKTLIVENMRDPDYEFDTKDALVLITATIAEHSPFRLDKHTTAAVLEYREMFKLLERYYNVERKKTTKRLYPFLYRVLFLWPQDKKETMLPDYQVEQFYEALQELRDVAEVQESKIINEEEPKHTLYKQMTFSRKTYHKSFTTLFYLGNGKGMNRFVHKNEFPPGSLNWKSAAVRTRLCRLHGVRTESNRVSLVNPWDPNRSIDIITEQQTRNTFSKGRVSFYLGFSWKFPIALNIVDSVYTANPSVPGYMPFPYHSQDDSDDQDMDERKVLTYSDYRRERRKIERKLREIHSLKAVMHPDMNQTAKLSTESSLQEQLENLEQMYMTSYYNTEVASVSHEEDSMLYDLD